MITFADSTSLADVLTAARPSWRVPLTIESPRGCSALQPVTFGLPFPPGCLRLPQDLTLCGPKNHGRPVQAKCLAAWPDGSAKWLLVDALFDDIPAGEHMWVLKPAAKHGLAGASPTQVTHENDSLIIDTGQLHLRTQPGAGAVFSVGGAYAAKGQVHAEFVEQRGRSQDAVIEDVLFEESGPVRATLRILGQFRGPAGCRFVVRLSCFAGTGLVRMGVTLHNPRRAQHPGGLWDLGDNGSALFRALTIKLRMRDAIGGLSCRTEPDLPWRHHMIGSFELYQASSGGENWQSRNHVNRVHTIPLAFCGYAVSSNGERHTGRRASPLLCVHSDAYNVGVAVPEMWQQFPKSINVTPDEVAIGLFPAQSDELHELQGGEQKTHTLWFDFAATDATTLDWVHSPGILRVPREWYAHSGAIPGLTARPIAGEERLDRYLAEAIEGPESLFERREVIDEYGWRNYGEVYADHENAHYRGKGPVVSHYNNQYDFLQGALQQFFRTGGHRWWQLGDALARHVIDIDIYHTDRDKAAYNGGLFWHTDHYRDAVTCTHRAFSRANADNGRAYGGGPCNEHNYTTGLLLYYYCTGDPEARAAVLSLVDWVIAMDDGPKHALGIFDRGPTGLASATGEPHYHGPGRGAANSINALVDGWLLTDEEHYLKKAEELIRRCIHPRDDVDGRDLLNVELRWSYTVFLEVLARYLDVKCERGQMDPMYAYAQASLLRYAEWMLANERPYFDQTGKLEYPTETWAAQELRKANVLRWAARHADDRLAARFRQRGNELAEGAWTALERFPTRASTRALAIVLRQGLWDACLRTEQDMMPRASAMLTEGNMPRAFTPQKERVRARLRSPFGLATLGCQALLPWNWGRLWSLMRA